MSWINPYKQFLNLVCKVSPNGKTCENYLRKEYPECFPPESYLELLSRIPHKVWKQLFPGQHQPRCHHHNQHQSCPYESGGFGLFFHDHDSYVGCFFRSLILIAISIGILYAIFKAVSQRRSSLP